ncbi:hypothetical protein [Arthrobacter sp. B0490]|uniref:hypothetical protein n=1 Tax=Arthrobacter sp. B0490 TaxID=2058891 RepID=UPI000CE419B5|nr:hypothetical protein [Arthrobacter sp. B0490]
MTDLQCPATAVLLAADAGRPDWLARLRVAAWFDLGDGQDAPDLAGFLEETADRFRGETFVVTAPAEAVGQAVRRAVGHRAAPGAAPVVVEIDSDGWRFVAAPGPGGPPPA